MAAGLLSVLAGSKASAEVSDTDVPIFITIGQSNADGSAFFNATLDNQMNEWYNSSANSGKMKIWYRSSQVANQTSNALGEAARWAVDGTTTDVAPGWLNLWYRNENTEGRTAMNMIHSFGTYSTGTDTNCAQGRRGMEGAFGKAFQTAYPDKELYILKLGVSGSFISSWANPSDDTNWEYFYQNIFKPAITDLLAKGKRPRLAGVWWMQGCADSKATQAYYQACLERLVSRIENELGFPAGKIYIGHIIKPNESTINPTGSTQFAQSVRDAQDAVAAAHNNVEIIDTKGFPMQYETAFNGYLHFNHEGVNAIGEELASRVKTAGQDSWAVFTTPGRWYQNGNDAKFIPAIGAPEISYNNDGTTITATLTYPGFTETKTYTLKDESAYLGPGYLDCDGTRYMRIPQSDDFSVAVGEAMTISFDMNIPSWAPSGSFYGLICNNYRNSSRIRSGFDIYMGSSASQTLANNLVPNSGSTTQAKNFGGAFITSGYTPGEWAHIVWTFDNATRESKIYINGVVKRETTGTETYPLTSFSDIIVGARWQLNDDPTTSIINQLVGKISGLRFYKAALTPEEVVADADGAVEGKELIAAYDFYDINGLTVTDITGNGHDATLVGFPEYVNGANVSVEQATGGSVEVLKDGTAIVNGSKISAGTTLTINATPHTGYTLQAITVNGQPIEGNTYVMGTEDITISATFEHDSNAPTKVLVFGMNENGSKFYRIPAICCTPSGTLIAVADKRGSDISDLPNTISVVMKRSTDNGDTWSEAVTLAEGNSATRKTYGDPAIVCDRNTGTILCVFVGDTGFFTSPYGTTKQGLYYVKSTDDGVTWTEPKRFNDDVWQNDWYAAFIASGAGHQDKSGRIMFVANARVTPQQSTSGVYEFLVYTDDLGETWHVANPTGRVPEGGGGNESKVVELTNGDLLMSMRYGNQRRFMKSTDGGKTWGAPYNVPALIEPSGSGCNGDIIRYDSNDGQTRLLQSSAASYRERRDVSVFLSYDEGETWPIKKRLIDGRSAYSALTVLKDGSIGCFVEDGWGQIGDMTSTDGFNLYFMRFTLDWLTDGADAPDKPGEKSPGYLDCDGTRYMYIPNDDSFNIPAGGSFTVSFRTKLDQWAPSGQYQGFVSNNSRNASYWRSGFELFSGSSAAQTLGLNVTPDNSATSDATNFGGAFITSGITVGEWAHVVWSYDGATGDSKIYINGNVLRETNNANTRYPINSFKDILVGTRYSMQIGTESHIDMAGALFGDIDDLRFYSDALSASEVKEDANGIVTGKTLIAAYDFAEMEGSSVTDISGNGHTGVLVGFPDYAPEGKETYSVTIQTPQESHGTLKVFNGETEIYSGRRIEEGTVLTITATPTENFLLEAILVNGEPLEEGVNTVTVTEDVTISAEFVRDPNAGEATYTEPTGDGLSDDNCYVETMSTTGAASDVTIRRTQKNGTNWELCDDQTIVVNPGQTFTANWLAKCTTTNTSSAPSPQDLRYCVATIFVDWDADGTFTKLAKFGKGADESGFAGNIKANYDLVLDITQNITVPEDAVIGRTRIRIIYTEAWDSSVKGGGDIIGNYTGINKGYAYDYIVEVAQAAPANHLNIVSDGEGSVEVWSGINADTNLPFGSLIQNGDAIPSNAENIYVFCIPGDGQAVGTATYKIGENPFTPTLNAITTAQAPYNKYTKWFSIDNSAITDDLNVIVSFISNIQGIGEIGIDPADGPIEIYNLQGIRVDVSNITPGLYIIRQGGKTKKVFIMN